MTPERARDPLDEALRLRRERQPFALATVVAARPPASATPGARAIVLPDGRIQGWVGGHCAQPTVVRQALAALAEATPRLVVLSPDLPLVSPADAHGEMSARGAAGDHAGAGGHGEAGGHRHMGAQGEEGAHGEMSAHAEAGGGAPGVVRVPMRCAGQGELEIFVEPFLPRVALAIVGVSPVARALARLGTLLDFEVWACAPSADMEVFPEADRLVDGLEALRSHLTARHVVLVATIGEYDEEALQLALAGPAAYVGLIASERRFAAVVEELRARGVSEERVARLKRPKGLPGRALLPAEIAFSAMAELIEVRRRVAGLALEEPAVPRAEATDPICGMTVDVATARYHAERDGQTYYFCSASCLAAFKAGTRDSRGGGEVGGGRNDLTAENAEGAEGTRRTEI